LFRLRHKVGLRSLIFGLKASYFLAIPPWDDGALLW
jgi:hypothetical protein